MQRICPSTCKSGTGAGCSPRPGRRTSSGTSMAELPAAMWLLFVALLFPLMILAITSIRASFMGVCAKDAAHAASKAKVFQNANAQPGDPPDAVTLAVTTAQATAQGLGGITIDSQDVKTRIVISTLGSPPQVSFSDDSLAANSIDTVNNVYSVQVLVTGKAEPIIKFPDFFGSIPGLTKPLTMTAVGREIVENPQMLVQPSGGGGGDDGGGESSD